MVIEDDDTLRRVMHAQLAKDGYQTESAPDVPAALAIALATTGVVAGPWYVRNAHSVHDALVGSGYGEGATPFGHHYSIASWGYWTKELRLDLSYTWLPLAAAVLLCFGVALAYLVARHPPLIRAGRPRSAQAAAVLALVLVVLEGYVALTSSRNEGTGFPLPWLPALIIVTPIDARASRAAVRGRARARPGRRVVEPF